jgi:glucokinase
MELRRLAIGVDVGGSHISCKLYDLKKNRLLRDKLFSQPINNSGDKDEILDTFEELLKPALSDLRKTDLAGIGLAFPGPFDYVNGTGLFTGENAKYIHLNRVNVRDELSARLDIHPGSIRFINDATAFALGEYVNGTLQQTGKCLAITLGTGFGAAFLSAGIPVIKDKTVPSEGCLWHLPFEDGIADDYFSTRGLISRFETNSGQKVEGVKELSELYNENEYARSVFTDFGYKLACFLGPWIKSFEVEKLVIGGNISKAFSKFEEPLNRELAGEGVEINPSILLEDAAFIGSAVLLKNAFYRAIKEQLKYM